MDTKDKRVHFNFSVSRNLLILGVAIAGAFLVVAAVMILRGKNHYQNRGMMRGDMMRQGDRNNGGMMMQKRRPGGPMGQYPVDVMTASTSVDEVQASTTVR